MKPTAVTRNRHANAILVASYGTFSTGINIRNLKHIVLASPTKSRYRVLQSVGRGLRLHPTKRIVHVMDLIDDARHPTYVNYAYRHWTARAEFYQEEMFPIEVYTHEIPAVVRL